MNEDALKRQINMVVEAREKAREANCQRVAEYNKWLEANQSLFDNETATKLACNEAEGALREMAIEKYSETGDKAVAPGVAVKIFEVLDYEPKEAFKWAMAHQIALSLDKKSFETLAKATPLEFVTIKEEPRAQIAQDLTNCTKGDTL